MIESLLKDIQHAVRAAGKARAFTAIVVLTLALGIGANTAVFSVLNAVLIKPLPYAESQNLMRLYLTYRGDDNYLPGPAVVDFRERSRTLDIAALYNYRAEGVDLTDRQPPERVGQLEVSSDYFRVMRANLLIGQPFPASDERPGAHVAVVSTRIWQEYLGRSADAIGRTLTIDSVPYRIAGVMPEGFEDPLLPDVEVWTPLDMEDARAESWVNNYLSAIARLRPGVTLAEARAELAAISSSQQAHYAVRDARGAHLTPLQADLSGGASRLLLVLQGAVVLLLVIACVNVASLFLARASGRQAELAVRAALGCSRPRLVRQVLIESVGLAVVGGVAGLLLGLALERALVGLAPLTFATPPALDGSVFAFTFVVTAAAGVLFGLAPALQFTRPDLETVLRESGRGSGGSRRQTRTRNAFVVCQVALALVLLAGAGLLLRTFERLIHERVGIRTGNIVTFEINLPDARYGEPERRARFHVDLEERLARLPGVTATGAVSRLPLTGNYHVWGTQRPGQERGIQPQQRVIEGDYFRALQIPLLQGRTFDAHDDARAPERVVISHAVAASLFPGENPIGQQLSVAGTPSEVIGVVGDVPTAFRSPSLYAVYHSHTQFASNRNWPLIEVLALGRPVPNLLDAARHELAALDPALVLYRPRMLDEVAAAGMAQERFALSLVGAFAVLAVILAGLGLYGVLSYAVSQRTREIGIRLALGAQPGSVRRLIVGQGGQLTAAGVLAGLAGAFWLTRGLQSLLFKVSATDPLVFAAATAIIVAVSLAAAAIPARAAMRVDPLDSLREQ